MDAETVDVEITDRGSLVSFKPLTLAATTWFEDHVQAEPWQWFGGALQVDHRMAEGLLAGVLDAGLRIGG